MNGGGMVLALCGESSGPNRASVIFDQNWPAHITDEVALTFWGCILSIGCSCSFLR